MHGELNQADRAAKKQEHAAAEIDLHDAHGTSLDSGNVKKKAT